MKRKEEKWKIGQAGYFGWEGFWIRGRRKNGKWVRYSRLGCRVFRGKGRRTNVKWVRKVRVEGFEGPRKEKNGKWVR